MTTHPRPIIGADLVQLRLFQNIFLESVNCLFSLHSSVAISSTSPLSIVAIARYIFMTKITRKIRLEKADEIVRNAAMDAWQAQAAQASRLDLTQPPDWFHPGQLEAWKRTEDSVLLLCGTQSGKTVFQPWWMLREMQMKGPGDYGAASPTFKLMYRKLLPEYRRVFTSLGLGRFVESPVPRFEFSQEGLYKVFGRADEGCTLHFCHASNSDSLESMTLRGFASDECGQRAFAATSFEAIERRLAISGGRHLMGSTPYDWGYLKTNIYDRWINGDRAIAVINFSSLMNPTFPLERYERARERMPTWRFEMMYDGKFTKPAGMIYDCFDPEHHCVKRFPIPDYWRRYVGLDFGVVNTAGVYAAFDPVKDRYVVYRTYHKGSIPVAGPTGHVSNLMLGEPAVPHCFGGAWSENDWRDDFTTSGFPVTRPPVRDVEAGIQSVYSLLKSGRLVLFDDLTKLVHELMTYSREVNDSGEPLLAIADKHSYHRADALRYLCVGVNTGVDEKPAVIHRSGPAKPTEEPELLSAEEIWAFAAKQDRRAHRFSNCPKR